ncbi:sensor histidine kinase [Kitasatospora griseola]|uniref:sensor histidine kinase n=1 Tax=Kitasatospora griseola TaxID=2064 RepID=UPI000A41400D|nr:histidine kinase [Kitasatospora griseola]
MVRRLRGPDAWWRPDRPVARGWWVALDGVVAWASAGIAVGGAGWTASLDHGTVASRIAVVVWFAALVGRRIVPVGALWAGAAATVAVVLAGDPVTNLSLASALPLVVLGRSRPPVVAAALAAVPVAAVLAALSTRPGFVLVCVVHAASAAVGVATRLRLERAEQRRRTAAELRAERLISDERARMARELHDAVGHAVTVMVTHAGAARLCLPGGPPEVRVALERIERVGRDAMTDLDRVLGLLRPVPPLVHALRALLADLPPHLSPTLELDDAADRLTERQTEAFRRIVQESLTNTLKHSTATATTVRLAAAPDALRLTVTDNGSPTPGSSHRTSHRGLASMHRRAAALGGTLTAGPVADGWRVEVELPWQ